jgi:polyketide biosynthesis acyl carrier protein
MTRDEVFAVVAGNILQVVPDITEDDVRPGRSMAELGASSLDRLDVVLTAQADLGITVRTEDLAEVRDIGALVEILYQQSIREAG